MAGKQQGKALITFTNKGGGKGELLIYSEIGDSFWGDSYSAKQFAADLKALGDITELDVRVNSVGGSVFDGFAFYSLLNQHKATKTVYVDGLAASIASVLCMVGSKIIMAEASHMMIHDPYGGCMGTAEDMRRTAELLDSLKGTIAGVYASRTGRPQDVFTEAMAAETWYTAEEALKAGLCTEISKNQALAACFDPTKFNYKNMPKDLVLENASEDSSEAGSTLKVTLTADTTQFQEAMAAAQETAKNTAAVLSGLDGLLDKVKAKTDAATPKNTSENDEPEDEKPKEGAEYTETPVEDATEDEEASKEPENSVATPKLNMAKRRLEVARAAQGMNG